MGRRLPAAAALLLLHQARSHGTMMEPVPRQPESIYWYQVGCMIGCTCSGGGKETYPSLESVNCQSPATPTLTKASELTWNPKGTSPKGDWTKYMPWRAPGTSKPIDSCGIASGFDPNAAVQYPHNFIDGTKQGTKGTDLPAGKVTVWAPGATVEASYRLNVNHGGGYQFRVCPKTETPTETCFNANPLAFANGKTTINYATGKKIVLDAVDVTTGVQPAGHAWRRLPIPGCNCDLGHSCRTMTSEESSKKADMAAYTTGVEAHGHCTLGLQFDAPHLHDGSWTEGFGYYVDKLGEEATKVTKVDKCMEHDKTTCDTKKDSCAWYEGKGCYEAKAGKEDACTVLKDQTGCEAAASKSGCTWYASKNLCYKKKTRRLQGFSGAGSKDSSVHQWWVTDELKAPSKPGDYILQWRWDNEQTPQIWTTCADICVGDSTTCAVKSTSGALVSAGLSVGGSLLFFVAALTNLA